MIYCIICVMGPVKYFSLGPSKSLSGPGPLVRVTVGLGRAVERGSRG